MRHGLPRGSVVGNRPPRLRVRPEQDRTLSLHELTPMPTPSSPSSKLEPKGRSKAKPKATRRRMLIAGGIALVVSGVAAAVFYFRSPVALFTPTTAAAQVPDEEELSVATYNVNYGVAGDPSTVRTIQALNADVIVLQETTDEWQQHIEAQLFPTHPHQYWLQPDRGLAAAGLAIVSRFPLRGHRISDSPVGWFRALSVQVGTPDGDVQVINVHLEPPLSASALWNVSDHHETEIRHHLSELRDTDVGAALPIVIAGDFNEERAGALRVLEEEGLVNAGALFAPGDATWKLPSGPSFAELTLDHVLVGEGMHPVNAQVLSRGRSDHLPLVVGLRRSER